LLYLESSLAPHVFTPARISVLELLASQAAISLENARLYGDLGEREARIRRLVEANIIGVMIWSVDGEIIEANEAFLGMLGYSSEDLISGRLNRNDLTPAEWHDADDKALARLRATGTIQPREKEYFRKDGSRIPVLVGAASLEGSRDETVAFVVDLSERKRAEESLRESQRQHGEAQLALAHANRVTTMGQLTASIAHEVNQPLAAVLNAAAAGQRWLDRGTPTWTRRAALWIGSSRKVIGQVR
jgi:PAS domain S-box-containing protein